MSNDFKTKIEISAIDRFSSVAKNISSSISGLRSKAADVSTAFRNVGSAASDFGRRLGGIALAAGAAGAGIFNMATRHGAAAEQIQILSQRTGIATRDIQRLQYVAGMASVSNEEMATSFRYLNTAIRDAATDGTSEAARAFKSMGISVTDSNGKIKDTHAIMLEVSDVYSKSADDQKKFATTSVLLGARGEALLPVLNQGAEAIRKQGDELERLGFLMTDEDLAVAAKFDDDWFKVGTVIKGVAAVFSQELIPILSPMILEFTEWAKANKDIIRTKITEFVKDLGAGLRDLWSGLKSVWTVVKTVSDAFGGFGNVIKILAGVYLLGLISSFGSLLISIVAVAPALAALMAPIAPFIVAAGAAIVVVRGIRKSFDDLFEATDGLKMVTDYFDKIANSARIVKEMFTGIKAPPAFAESGLGLASPVNGNQEFIGANAANDGSRLNQAVSKDATRLSVMMKIDSEGRPKDVTATSNNKLDFTANTGVMY